MSEKITQVVAVDIIPNAISLERTAAKSPIEEASLNPVSVAVIMLATTICMATMVLDKLDGGAGNDTLNCGLGVDTLPTLLTALLILLLSLSDCLIGKVRLNMNEILAATLGELQTEIYWLHDAEEFAELALVAATIYMKLGYTQQQSETAGNLISQAYQLADDAALAQKAGSYNKEMQFYDQAKNKLTQAETTLVYQTSIATHQIKWWMYFRHKQKLQILLHLFLQNFKAVGLRNLLTALKLTYFLMEIGRVHKSRDIETTKRNAIKYWNELLKIKPPQYPYLG